MVWCGVVWCGVVWCGVVWCGVVCGVYNMQSSFLDSIDHVPEFESDNSQYQLLLKSSSL